MTRWVFVLTILLALTMQVFAAQVERAADRDMPMKVSRIVKTPTKISMTLNLEEPEWVQAGNELDDAVIAQYGPMAGHIEAEGFPVVPVTSRMFRIPPRSGVRVDVISSEYETYTDIEYAAFFGGDKPEDYRPSAKGEDTWYPGTLAEVTDPVIFHDFRTCNLATYPVQVNTARKEVRVYSNIAVDVSFEGIDRKSALDDWPTRVSETFLPWYREFLDWNDNELDEYEVYRGGVQVVMRDDNQLLGAMQPWIEWKRQKGWEVELLTDDDCAWSTTGIRGELRDRYEDEIFDYVVIIGDINGLFSTPSSGTNDYYYCTMNNDDIYQDVVLGRISVQDMEDIRNYVNKVILYERDPYMDETDWYLQGAGLAVWDYAGTSGIQTCEYAKLEALRIGYEEFGISVHRTSNTTATIQRMNAGISFYAHRGGISTGIPVNSIRALTNNRMLFPAPEYTCGTGTWAATECISEAWMRAGTFNSPKGAIGGFGLNTNSTHCSFNNGLAVGGSYAALNLRHPALGMMLWGGQQFLWNAFHPDWCTGGYTFQNFANQANLMGDPTCWIWTAIPESLSVDAAETIQIGRNSYTVEVLDSDEDPVAGAWVTLYKVDDDEEIIARGTSDENGVAILNAPFRYEGEAMLTVTAQNCIPNRTVIEVTVPNARIGYEEITFQDDGNNGTDGNDNGIPEAGETVGLVINAHNFGGNNQTNITITADTEDEWVESLDGEVTVDAINAGGEEEGEGLILVEISPEAQHDWILRFDLEFDTDAGNYSDEYSFKVNAPHYFFIQVEGAEDMDPGDETDITIEIINLGGSDAGASDGRLTILHPFGNATDATGTFSAMDIGEDDDAEFTIASHPESFHGYTVPAQLVVTTDDGQVDTVWFSIVMGTRDSSDPSGPDNYGYYAFDNTDTDYEMAPEYDWIEINPDENGNDYEGEDTGVDDPGDDGDTCAVFELPFVVQFYGQTFDSITISSNGHAAFGSWPDMDFTLRNAPIPGPYGMPNMVAPYWDERAQGEIYHFYDEDNHRYIIEWFETKGRTGTASYGNNCTFEIIIYDRVGEHRTWTLDNDILFQYADMNRHLGYGRSMPWWTTGIQNSTYDDGLMYFYYNESWPGAVSTSDCEEDLAILFTTNVAFIVGTLEGTVTDSATGEPMEGIFVSTTDHMYEAETDADGYFVLEEIVTGEHNLEFLYECFIDTLLTQLVVIEDETTTVSVAMRHSELEFDTLNIEQELVQGDEIEYELMLTNNGNGPLFYSARIHLSDPRDDTLQFNPGEPGELDEMIPLWEEAFEFELTEEETRNRGIVFVDQYYFVTGSDNFDPTGPNKMYQYSRFEGELIATFDQPVPEEYRTSQGIYGMAYDGQYIYGADGDRMIQMEFLQAREDMEDEIVLVDSWEIPVEDPHYLAYDQGYDYFWIGDINSPVYAVNRAGAIVEEFEQEFSPRGAAWNPTDENNYNLYFFARRTAETITSVVRMNPSTGETETIFEYDTPGGGLMASCADITSFWNPLISAFATVIDDGAQDGVKGWVADESSAFFEILNPTGTLEGGGERAIDIVFRGSNLPIGNYPFFLDFENSACEFENNIISVTMVVPDTTQDIFNDTEVRPLEWAFRGAYPNPFNPAVTISYSLKQTALVKARVFNLLGQEVAVLAEQPMSAGYHNLTFDGSELASGIYFLQFEAGPISEMKKLILMK
ncbi:MAG: C25 family cysteine peptidase [Candidatus Electryonea clarkiae]|nr:C25 family cysteine peptidase [Candidatus Electryonea clarkiae]MDP8287808.1 C25 family cysteine peptidase [Candidatus Electryonea clarkiae]